MSSHDGGSIGLACFLVGFRMALLAINTFDKTARKRRVNGRKGRTVVGPINGSHSMSGHLGHRVQVQAIYDGNRAALMAIFIRLLTKSNKY